MMLFSVCIIILGCNVHKSEANVKGVTFSPFVRKGDPENSMEYTKDIMKVMLEVIMDANFTSVTTYSVGAPNRLGDFQLPPWWSKGRGSSYEPSSLMNTASAAAEINKAKNYTAITVYQGIYPSSRASYLAEEIKQVFQATQQANKIFPGTVPALTYPSVGNLDQIMNNIDLAARIKNLSTQAHNLNLKYGVRLVDCQNFPTGDIHNFWQVASHLDFIICLFAPGTGNFDYGYLSFKKNSIDEFLTAESFVHNTVNLSNVELILETGWPGSNTLGEPSTVTDLKKYWEQIMDWGLQTNHRVYLHEAFDNPWKEEHPEWSLSSHLGLWQYNPNQPLLSKDAYIIKNENGTLFPPSTDLFKPKHVSKPTNDKFNFSSSIKTRTLGYLGGAGDSDGRVWTMAASAAFLLFLAMSSIIAVMYKRMRRMKVCVLSEDEVRHFLEGSTAEKRGDSDWEKSAYDKAFEMDKNQLSIDYSSSGVLGMGQFGCVYKGILKSSEISVAVKMPKPGANAHVIKSILLEIKILIYVGPHTNICALVGAFTKEISKGLVYFSMELCECGSLDKYLKINRDELKGDFDIVEKFYSNTQYFSPKSENGPKAELQLLRWSLEIASAMDFISSKHVIHSDVATRNVLLTGDLTAKLTDFGLSRHILTEELEYAKKGDEPLPWKWMAIESLESKIFSTKSDVWAYGITLWEIFSLGSSPHYQDLSSWNGLIEYLKSGNRLDKPDRTPANIYEIMTKCWTLEPKNRPTFRQIMDQLVSEINSEYEELHEPV